jgi:hypothetical protein
MRPNGLSQLAVIKLTIYFILLKLNTKTTTKKIPDSDSI